ncbi:hypothetical protein GpartN1_g3623.t1 [Galdieria partita]|uniref:DUF2428 domain-containing protein n=1 Tax=Galdieria partita TaxID=83374 RepID=A0A9C7PYH3_9RHOD|nr:hypothetical protein GpartN1_g3623.t1 [Galdieria partita]
MDSYYVLHEKCSECSEIENTLQSLQLSEGVRNQTICIRKLGSWLRCYMKQGNVCQVAMKKCVEILAMFSSGQEDSVDHLGNCLPLANSVQSVALHILEELGLLDRSLSRWIQIMVCRDSYSGEQPLVVQMSVIVERKFAQLLQKVFGYLKFRSPQADLFHSVFSYYFETDYCSFLLRSPEDTQHLLLLRGIDIRFASVLVYEASSRALFLYPLYKKEQTTYPMKQQDISIYENECCILWFGFIIVSSDVLYEYCSLFCEEEPSERIRHSMFFSRTSLPDANNYIESAMKLLRHCLWMALSDDDEFQDNAIMNFISRTNEVRMLLNALATKLEWFLHQETNPRDSILAAGFSWVFLISLLWKERIEKQNVTSQNDNEVFDICHNFETWMKSKFPSFSKLAICIGVMDYMNYMNVDLSKFSSERTLDMTMNKGGASLLMAIFTTLKSFCQLREDSHFHFMALDALRRCILKLIEYSLMTAELIREIFQILWQRCQEPIRGISNQVSDIIQSLISISSDSRVSDSEQQRMKLFWKEFYQSLLVGKISTKAQFVIIQSLVSFMGGSYQLLEISPNFQKQALLAVSIDQSCSTSAARCLETFWKLLLEEVGEQHFIEKTVYDLLCSIMVAKCALHEERLISQALGVYLKLPKDRTNCLVRILISISKITRDYWHTTRLKLIVLSSGRKLCPGLRLHYLKDFSCFSVSDGESTVKFFLDELNLALSSQDDICRFAVIDLLTESSSKLDSLDSFELHLLPKLMPWFLYESKPSASWRFLHIVSRLLKRLERGMNVQVHERQTFFHEWEHNVGQKEQPMASIADVDIFIFQTAQVMKQMHLLFLYNLVASDVNTYRQQNASNILKEWMLNSLDKDSVISTGSKALTQQLLYTYYISMLNGSEKHVKTVSQLLASYELHVPLRHLSFDWIWKVCFHHLKNIRSAYVECGAQIIRLVFNSFVKTSGYFVAEWDYDNLVKRTQDNSLLTGVQVTDPAIASFYFISWFINQEMAKFDSSIVIFSNSYEEDWLFGYFVACKYLFLDGWKPQLWLNYFTLETIRSKVADPLKKIISFSVMESLKGVGYVEPWIGVYLQSISNQSREGSLIETVENESSFQRKLMVGSFHCLKEVCSLIAIIIQTVCEQKPVEYEKTRAQPSYVTKGLRKHRNSGNSLSLVWTIQDIEYLFSLQIEVICCTTHSGVMECGGESLLLSSSALFRSTQSEFSELPRKKVFQVLSELSNAKFYSLRRSAGLPYFVHAVCLAAEQARLKEIAPRVLQELVDGLENFLDKDKAESFSSRIELNVFSTDAYLIHCMNILQFLLQDGSLSDVTMNFAERSFINARRAYASSKWSIRNSAMLLAGAALRRILKISGEAREREYSKFVLPVDSIVLPSVHVENETVLTYGELFGKRFPNLFSHILSSLKQVQNELLQKNSCLKSDYMAGIYPILCLLSTLRNSSSNFRLNTIRYELENPKLICNLAERSPHPFCSSYELQLLPLLIEKLVIFLQVREQYIRLAAGTSLCRMVRGTPWSLQLWMSLLESLPLIPFSCLCSSESTADKIFQRMISWNIIQMKFTNSQQHPWYRHSLLMKYSPTFSKFSGETLPKPYSISFSFLHDTTKELETALSSMDVTYLLLPRLCYGCRIVCYLQECQVLDIQYNIEETCSHYNEENSFPCDFQVISLSSIQNMLQGKLFTCIKLFEENILYWKETMLLEHCLKFLNGFVLDYLSWIAVSVCIPPLTRSMWFTWMCQLLKILKDKTYPNDDVTIHQLKLRIHENAIDWIFQILFLEYQCFVTRQESCADGLRVGQTQLVIESLRLLETIDEKWLFSFDSMSFLSSLSMKDEWKYPVTKERLLTGLPNLLERSCLQIQREIMRIFEKWTKYWLSEGDLDKDAIRDVLKWLGIRLEEILTNSSSASDIVAAVLSFYRRVLTHMLYMVKDNGRSCISSSSYRTLLECICSGLQNLSCKSENEFMHCLLVRTKQIIGKYSSYTVLEEAFPLYTTILQFQDVFSSSKIDDGLCEQERQSEEIWLKDVEFFLEFVETNPYTHPIPFRMAILDSLHNLGVVLFRKIFETTRSNSYTRLLEINTDSKSSLKNVWIRFSLCIMQYLQDEYPDVRNGAAESLYYILKDKYELPACQPNWFQALNWIFNKCLALEFIMLHDETYGSVLCHSLVSFIRKTLCLSFQVMDSSDKDNSDYAMYEIHPSYVIERVLKQWQNYFHSSSMELFDFDPNNSFEEPLLQMQHLAVLCRTILLSSYGESYSIWRRRSFEKAINHLYFLLSWVFYIEEREMIGFLPEFFRPVYILLLDMYILDEGHETYRHNGSRIDSAIWCLQKLSKDDGFRKKIHKILADNLENFLDWHFQDPRFEEPRELLFLLGRTC